MNMLQQKDGIKYGNLSHDAGNDTAAKYCTPERKNGKIFLVSINTFTKLILMILEIKCQ